MLARGPIEALLANRAQLTELSQSRPLMAAVVARSRGGRPAKVEAWLAALEATAAEQPAKVSRQATLRLVVGARAWSIACIPDSEAPVVVQPIDGSADAAAYDCTLTYESEDVWRDITSGALNPRSAMKAKQMSLDGPFKVVMGLRGLFKAATEAMDEDYSVSVSAAAPGTVSGGGAAAGPACCASPRQGGRLGGFRLRVVRLADGTAGEGDRSAAECRQLALSLVERPFTSAEALERALRRLLRQESERASSPIWEFVRLPPPEKEEVAQAVDEERVAAAEEENAALREKLVAAERALLRREHPLYSILATPGLWWLVLCCVGCAWRAVSAHADALASGAAAPVPDAASAGALGGLLLAIRVVFSLRGRVRAIVLLTLLLKAVGWLGLETENPQLDLETLRSDPLAVLTALGAAGAWAWAWAWPALLTAAAIASIWYARLPAESNVRRRGKMYGMFWRCAARYGVTSLRVRGLGDENEEFHNALWADTHACIAEELYRATWSLRGFWIKLGQCTFTRLTVVSCLGLIRRQPLTVLRAGCLADISTRHDIALPVYTEKFTSFQDANCSAPFEEIKATVEASLGCPLEEVFASFEEESIASASIAQV